MQGSIQENQSNQLLQQSQDGQEKILELIKYSSPTDVETLYVTVDQNLTKNKQMFNGCTAVKIKFDQKYENTEALDYEKKSENILCFATFNKTKEEIDSEIIRSEIGKLLGINMPLVSRIATTDGKQEGLIIDTNLNSSANLSILSQLFANRKSMFMKMNKASAIAMNDFKAYFPTSEDLKNPQTTLAMLLKGVSSLPYNIVSSQTAKKKFIEEYYDMIVLDLLVGQSRRNGEDYYYYTETAEEERKIDENKEVKKPVITGHIIPGLLNYTQSDDKNSDIYYLNDFPVNKIALMEKLFSNNYLFIQRVVDSLISSITDYKDCISRIIYNNTSIENARRLEKIIFENIDLFIAQAHNTKKVAQHLNKIEKITSTTKMNLESVNRIIEFQHRYPTSKQEILDSEEKITKLKKNENGEYEASIGEGVKLTLNNETQQAGYASSGLLSALIAFVCGLGFGLAYIISHLK